MKLVFCTRSDSFMIQSFKHESVFFGGGGFPVRQTPLSVPALLLMTGRTIRSWWSQSRDGVVPSDLRLRLCDAPTHPSHNVLLFRSVTPLLSLPRQSPHSARWRTSFPPTAATMNATLPTTDGPIVSQTLTAAHDKERITSERARRASSLHLLRQG